MAPSYEERMGQLLTNNEVSHGVWRGLLLAIGKCLHTQKVGYVSECMVKVMVHVLGITK